MGDGNYDDMLGRLGLSGFSFQARGRVIMCVCVDGGELTKGEVIHSADSLSRGPYLACDFPLLANETGVVTPDNSILTCLH